MSRALIVGAGPVGASLAYLLARRGVAVTLLERRRDFAREFRGEVLMPSGIAALEQMGLEAQLDALPHETQRHIDLYLNGRAVFGGSLDARDSPRIMAVSQPALLEMLVREPGRQSSFELIRGASVTDLLREDGRITGLRMRGEDGSATQLRGHLVVGADGRNSIVRRACGLAATHLSPPMDIVWCKMPRPADWIGVRAFAGRGHLLIAYQTYDGTLQLGWVILKGTFRELRSQGIERWVEEMANHVTPDFADHLRGHRGAVERPFLLEAVADCVDRWSQPGALVLGDAAHTMSPVGGQGINVALRDAIVAANHLTPVLTSNRPDRAQLDAALATIERERVPEISHIQALQAQPPRVVLTRAWWGEPVRRVIGTLLRSGAFRQRAAGRVSAFFDRVTPVHLTV